MRQGVGIIVLNQKNEVFVGKRKDNPIDKWQMPQGGININETPFNAMIRELKEETSITKIKVLKEIEYWLEYELPPNLLGKIWKGKFRGQKQKWFIVKFIGDENEINLDIVGLMLIPPNDNDTIKYFKSCQLLNNSLALKELSMGMSADYIDAVKHGATFVRIGSSIFGSRLQP